MRATVPPGAAVASCISVSARRTNYCATAPTVEITTSSPAVPLNEYRSARTLAPKMGERSEERRVGKEWRSRTVMGTSVKAAEEVRLTAMKLNDWGCVSREERGGEAWLGLKG